MPPVYRALTARNGRNARRISCYAGTPLHRATNGHDAVEAVEVVANTLGLSGYSLASDLEQAMLDVWALSEATNAVAA